MPLLQRHGQGRESVLGGEGLAGPAGQQEPDDPVVVLLGRHVQRREPILTLYVDAGAVVDQDLDYVLLTGQGGNVQSGVSLQRNSFLGAVHVLRHPF